MDKTTHEVRLANWKALIERCQTRPKGQTAKQWLDANGISSKKYYYWFLFTSVNCQNFTIRNICSKISPNQ